MLRVYLFGAPRVERNGLVIPLRRTRQLALLAYMAVESQPCDRDTLLALLWPEFDDASARNNLRRELSLLKSTLGLEVLVVDRFQVRWNQQLDAWVDVAAFRSLVTAGLPATLDQALDVTRIAQLTAAAELYTAEFLAGFTLPDSQAFDEWQFFQRESLHQLYGQALEQLVHAHMSAGAVADAVPHARRWVALDPLHEPAQRTLIRLYAWSGQHSAALRQYQECVRVLRNEFDSEPEAETRALAEAIRLRRLEPSAPVASHASSGAGAASEVAPAAAPPIGSPATLFVGRDHELEQVTQLLVVQSGRRLVTLTGPGGIGKTRLALEAAASFAEVFPDGLRIVHLAPVSAPEILPQTVADALGLPEAAGRPAAGAVAEHLRDKRMLLVIDNCEHLIDACAHLVDQLLAVCPQLRILATSREVLGIPAEVIVNVQPLATPDVARLPPLQALARYEAVRLFVARAQAALPSFALTDANAAAIAQVCQQLDGIPLAIELAAARVRLLRVEQIAERLEDRFTLLTGGSRTALPRHQTLRALIDWSYELIAEPERELLRRLSVFAGGWSLEAAEAISGAAALERLGQLVNKSLVVVDHAGSGETRYRLLETIRQYARQRLAAEDDEAAMRQQHLAYFLALAERAEAELRGPAQTEWLDRLEAEHSNLRAAFEWALATNITAALVLAARLLWFWHMRGHKREGREWIERALAIADATQDAPSPPALARARALHVAGFLADMQGDFEQATRLLEASQALLREQPVAESGSLANTLLALGGPTLDRGDFDRAQAFLEQALLLFRTSDDTFGVAGSLGGLGRVALLRGQYEQARACWEERLALCTSLGDADGIADAGAHLGTVALWQGHPGFARASFVQSLERFRANGNRWGVGFTAIALGEAAHIAGDYTAAGEQFTAAVALGQDLCDTSLVAHAAYELGSLAASQGDYARASQHYEDVLALMRAADNPLAVGAALCALGGVAWAAADHASAARRFDAALELGQRAGHPITRAAALSGLAALARAQGDPMLALRLSAAALSERRDGGRHWRAWRRDASDHWGVPAYLEALAVALAELRAGDVAARLFGATDAWEGAVRCIRAPAVRALRETGMAAALQLTGRGVFESEFVAGRALPLDQAVSLALGCSKPLLNGRAGLVERSEP